MLERSFLFVPADRPDRYEKAFAAHPDAVIVDLEDAVAAEGKTAARQSLAAWLDRATSKAWVRVNAEETDWHDDDLALCRHAAVAGVLLPKAERVATIDAVANAVGDKPLLPMIESAVAFDNARSIAAARNVARLAFGSLDFQLDLGIPGEGEALLYFRSQLVLASRLAGRAAPVDGVTTDMHDAGVMQFEAERARELGFGGKLCIHPRQVEVVNRCFTPGEADRAWARRVLQAVERSGGAAVAVDGKMVDLPVIRRAERILAIVGEPRG